MLFLNFNQLLLLFLHYLIFPQLQEHRRLQVMLTLILNDRQHRPVGLFIRFGSNRAFKDSTPTLARVLPTCVMVVWEVSAGGDPHFLFFELHDFKLLKSDLNWEGLV